jgi:hypothetical protein
MIKELILALIIGAILGLGVTGSYLSYKGKQTPSSDKPLVTEPTLIPTISTAPTIKKDQEPNNPLTIISPSNNSLVSSANLSISGTTTPNSQIIIATAANIFTGQSDPKGKFSLPIKLESGFNIIKISSIDPQNNQFDHQLNITYSTAKI